MVTRPTDLKTLIPSKGLTFYGYNQWTETSSDTQIILLLHKMEQNYLLNNTPSSVSIQQVLTSLFGNVLVLVRVFFSNYCFHSTIESR